MLKHLQTIIITLALCMGTVWAGDVEDGNAAILKNDYVTALKKYKIAAAKNDAFAQIQIGNIYNEGLGVKQDYAEAMRWYKLAAAQGYAQAQTSLGVMYEIGNGVAQDSAEAMRWYKLAAAQGKLQAQNNLAIMYGKGQGGVEDYVRAHMWFNLAAAMGHSTAVKGRDIVAEQMTPQQRLEAQKLARECQARNFKNCD